MLNVECILQNDRLMRAMTGLNRKAFEQLLPSFTEAYQHRQNQLHQHRQRAPGGGRKATLRTGHYFIFCWTANAIPPLT